MPMTIDNRSLDPVDRFIAAVEAGCARYAMVPSRQNPLIVEVWRPDLKAVLEFLISTGCAFRLELRPDHSCSRIWLYGPGRLRSRQYPRRIEGESISVPNESELTDA